MIPDMSYQRGGVLAFPEWVPCMMPAHVESLTEQVTELFRGDGNGTTDIWNVTADERKLLEHAFTLEAHYAQQEKPF